MLPALLPILERLEQAGIAYVLIGGVAVVAHGVIRTTEDVDIVPAPDDENLRLLGNLMVELDARLTLNPQRGVDEAVRAALAKRQNVPFTTEIGDIDIVQRGPAHPGYEALATEADRHRVGDQTVSVCSREHLLAMKRAAGRPSDLADLKALESEH